MDQPTSQPSAADVSAPKPSLGKAPWTAFGTQQAGLGKHLVRLFANALWMPSELTAEQRAERIKAALAAVREMGARNTTEGMIALYAVAAHAAALNCLARAQHPECGHETRIGELRLAARLMNQFNRQLDAFDRQRGRVMQRITVEHVRLDRSPPSATIVRMETNAAHPVAEAAR
jgi:hypothetical protein